MQHLCGTIAVEGEEKIGTATAFFSRDKFTRDV